MDLKGERIMFKKLKRIFKKPEIKDTLEFFNLQSELKKIENQIRNAPNFEPSLQTIGDLCSYQLYLEDINNIRAVREGLLDTYIIPIDVCKKIKCIKRQVNPTCEIIG